MPPWVGVPRWSSAPVLLPNPGLELLASAQALVCLTSIRVLWTMVRDPDGTINYWGPGLERLYGFSSADVVGRISHKILKTEFPRSLKEIEETLFDTGQWRGELLHRKRNGSQVVIASHWSLWRDDERGRQVTEVHNETEEVARAYLASIVESSDDAIVGKTLDGIITSWNRAAQRMFGYEAAEICGKAVTLLIPPHRILEGEEILGRLRRGERIDHFETERVRKDGRTIAVSLTVSPIRDRGGRIVGASKIARDITEQRAAQKQLLELQSELLHAARLGTMGQMAAAITHELSQPLSAINSYLGGIARLLSDFAAPQNVAVALGKAREQTSRAGEIMRRLRDFAVRRESDLRVENIDEIVEQILKLALVDAAVRGVTARVQFAPGVKSILADKIQIGQVILNIARNAIEAMEEHFSERILTISTEIDDLSQEVVVRISDTGPGLAPEVKERLFQPFVTTKDKGMGIGLSICHGIVQSHGGMLSVEPNEPNGTTFVVRLPRAH